MGKNKSTPKPKETGDRVIHEGIVKKGGVNLPPTTPPPPPPKGQGGSSQGKNQGGKK